MKRCVADLSLAMLLIGASPATTVDAASLATPVQTICSTREQIVATLGSRFGETITAVGVDQEGNLIQVFSSAAGTWTIAITLPGGPTCLLSAGDGWTDVNGTMPRPTDRGS